MECAASANWILRMRYSCKLRVMKLRVGYKLNTSSFLHSAFTKKKHFKGAFTLRLFGEGLVTFCTGIFSHKAHAKM